MRKEYGTVMNLMRLISSQVEAMCNMGAVMNTLNRPDDAVDWWDKALQIEPTYWEVSVSTQQATQ